MLTFALGSIPCMYCVPSEGPLLGPSLPTRQRLLHNCLSAQIKGKGEVSVGPFETLIVALESLLLLSGDPGAGFQNFSEQRNLLGTLLESRFPASLSALLIQ